MNASNKKKIFCIIGQLGNGGTEKQLFLFLKYIDRNEYEPIVVVNNFGDGIWKSKIEDLGVKILSLKTYFTPFFKFIKFKYLLIKYKPDIIFAWSFFTNIYHLFSGKIPFIGSLRQQLSIEKQKLNYIHLKYCISDLPLIVNSSYVADELLKYGVPKEKISVINNIFVPYEGAKTSVDELRRQYNIPIDSVVILGVGRDSPSKDFGFFIDVIEKASEQFPKIHACLIGSGGIAWKEQIVNRVLDSQITVIGEIPDCRKIMHIGDIFFLSSKAEGLPNVVLEAIDAGCALLTTKVGGISDILVSLNEKLREKCILENRDLKNAVDQLVSLVNDKKLRKNISKSLKNGLSEFKKEKIMKKYIDVLEFEYDKIHDTY